MNRKDFLQHIKENANHVVDHFIIDSIERNEISIDVTEYAITSAEGMSNCYAVTMYSHKSGKAEFVKETLVETESCVMTTINAEMLKLL